MSLRKLPPIQARQELQQADTGIMPTALDRWNISLRAKNAADNEIDIFDQIGEDWDGNGCTVKSVAADLRRIGARDVIVNINSPGGDLFEGIGVYNALREHPHNVTVKILGIAASAAAIIAMSGDRVEIAESGFLMIHNAWVLAMGDRHDMRETADMLEPFDASIAGVFAAHTGIKQAKIAEMMDAETFIDGKQAVKDGFADAILGADAFSEDQAAAALLKPVLASRKIDVALAKQGTPRNQRREMLKEFRDGTLRAAGESPDGTLRATETATPSASEIEVAAQIGRMIHSLKS